MAQYPEEEKKQLLDFIFERIENGSSMAGSIRELNEEFLLNFSTRTFYDWIEKDKSGETAHRYARAREIMIQNKFDSIERDYSQEPDRDVLTGRVDHGWVAMQKLKIDSKKWELSKLMPKRYGDRLAIEADVKSENKTTIDYDKLSEEALEEIVKAAADADSKA